MNQKKDGYENKPKKTSRKSPIGVMINVDRRTDIPTAFQTAVEHGFGWCQIAIGDPTIYSDCLAEIIRTAEKNTGLSVSTLWAGWSGPAEWNFTGGPMTLGLVPSAYRMKRAEELIAAASFASEIGVARVATHVGFLPENRNDPEYYGILAILRYVTAAFAERGVCFLFETGQETPVTLLRVIEELGRDNVGVNMDTANLILYGKANSADAVTVLGRYIMDTHIKDGFYPKNGRELGREVKVREGMANLPEILRRLKDVGYTGNFIIEREITGDQQVKDILETKRYLETILTKEGFL